jgi:hypothetical protein
MSESTFSGDTEFEKRKPRPAATSGPASTTTPIGTSRQSALSKKPAKMMLIRLRLIEWRAMTTRISTTTPFSKSE